MRITASVTDVLRNFSDYINRVMYRGVRFVLVRGGREVAELGPVPAVTRLGDLVGILESLPALDEGAALAFEADLDAARAELSGHGPDDRWES